MIKDDCIFCKLSNGVFPTNSIYEDDDFNVILDAGPATKGHALILPKELKDVMKCKNPRCITSIEQELTHIFKLSDEQRRIYRCIYCETAAKNQK